MHPYFRCKYFVVQNAKIIFRKQQDKPDPRKRLILGGDNSDEIWTSDIKTCEWKLNTGLKNATFGD